MRLARNSGILIDIPSPMRSFHLSFDSSREISGALGLLVVAGAALVVAWFAISAGNRIISSTEERALIEMKKQSLESGFQH